MSRVLTIVAAVDAFRVAETLFWDYADDILLYQLRIAKAMQTGPILAGGLLPTIGVEFGLKPRTLTPEATVEILRAFWLEGAVAPGMPKRVTSKWGAEAESMAERFRRATATRVLPQFPQRRRRRMVTSRN